MDQLDGHNQDGEGNINKGVPFTLIKLIVLVLHVTLGSDIHKDLLTEEIKTNA